MSVIAQSNLIGDAISDSLLYQIIFFLHVLSAIIGFGTVFLNGIYGQQATTRRNAEGAAIGQATLAVSNVAEIFIYAVFVTGLIMGIMADEPVSLGDLWLSMAMLLFIVGIGISHGVLRPSLKKLNALIDTTGNDGQSVDAGTQGPATREMQFDALNKKVGAAGAALNILVIVILYLMIWKPGLT